MALKKGIEAATAAVSAELLAQAKEVETKEQIAATASISAADPAIGELIAEAMDKVGKEGVITVEESNTFGLELELTEGMRFDKGYISGYFVTDPERMEPSSTTRTSSWSSRRSARSRTCCRCWRRSSSPASRWRSSPRTWTARRCPPWS